MSESGELVVAALVPGMESMFPDWRRVTISDSPAYRFLQGEEGPYRTLMADESPGNVDIRVARFRSLLNTCRRMGIMQSITTGTRPDGCRVVINGNHRAAIALHLGIPLPETNVGISVLLRKIDAMARYDDRYADEIAPLRRAIATHDGAG